MLDIKQTARKAVGTKAGLQEKLKTNCTRSSRSKGRTARKVKCACNLKNKAIQAVN
jgi:hypothetical protein